MVLVSPAVAQAPTPKGARAEPVAFADLKGWAEDQSHEAFAVFRRHCAALLAQGPALRTAMPPPAALKPVCEAALALPSDLDASASRAFFQRHFQPYAIRPDQGSGFLTGYFEPEIAGSRIRTPQFSAPVYGRPADLVTLGPGDLPPGLDPALAAARKVGDRLEPYADRPAIYAGALAGQGLEQLYLKDEPEVFIVQVQGSARVSFPDGTAARLTYSGRTGHPYTSIGRILIQEGRIPQAEMSLARLMGWLRANPAEAKAVMERNRSYVFFQRIDDFDPALGPTGGAGVPLTPGRSLAVDRTIWAYGLPVWMEARIDTLPPAQNTLNRLVIAEDTGSAILGPARADYFWGTGEVAGHCAGLTRHALDFTVLWPRTSPEGPRP